MLQILFVSFVLVVKWIKTNHKISIMDICDSHAKVGKFHYFIEFSVFLFC